MPEYPKREPFHAHKLTRLLFKSCAIQDIGNNAALLVVHIAHTEDAARYQYPVRFWNGQLMHVMGWHSPKQLTEARRRAVEAGWLHYERDQNRKVGKYWTMIPPTVTAFNDEPIEPCFVSVSGTNNLSATGNISEIGTSCGTNSGKNHGTNSGKPSTLSLILFPIPDALNTDEFSQLWAKWLLHQQHVRGQAPSQQVQEAMLMECVRAGHDTAVRNIRFSISKNAKNILDASKPKPTPRDRPAQLDNMPLSFEEAARLLNGTKPQEFVIP